MLKKLYVLYFILLHIVLGVVLTKSDFIEKLNAKFFHVPPERTKHYFNMVAFHNRLDKNLPEDSVLFFGDSHIQGLAVTNISDKAVNFGIGNDTSYGVMQRLGYYSSILHSRAVFIAIGYNDFVYREDDNIIDNIKKIIEFIPSHVDIFLCALNPIITTDESINKRIKSLNIAYKQVSEKYTHVTYVSAYNAFVQQADNQQKLYLNDGIHLSKDGYDLWIKELKQSLIRVKSE